MNKRKMFLIEVMVEKDIPDHADLIAGRIYGITGTKIVGDASVSPVTVWQIDPMDSTSMNLAQAIVENLHTDTSVKPNFHDGGEVQNRGDYKPYEDMRKGIK